MIKNPDLENLDNIFGRRPIPLQEFILNLSNINNYPTDNINSYLIGCIFISLVEDKSYFANAIINEPSELNIFLEELVKKVLSKKNIRDYYNGYNPQLGDEVYRRYWLLFRNGEPTGNFLNLLESIAVVVQHLSLSNSFPVFHNFKDDVVEIAYTNDPNVYKKLYLMIPESMILFVEKYYQGNYGESVPMNLVSMCLEETYTFLQGDTSLDDIFTIISSKVLNTIELDKYDPHKSGYYTNIEPIDFSNLLYLNTVNLLKLFSENFTKMNEMSSTKYLKYMDASKICIWSV